jgi:hypothetical protein
LFRFFYIARDVKIKIQIYNIKPSADILKLQVATFKKQSIYCKVLYRKGKSIQGPGMAPPPPS